MYDGCRPRGASRIKPEGIYLAFKILADKDSWFFKILKQYLASSALLKLFKSRKPMPPCCFDLPILSHFIKCTFVSFSQCPHQYHCIIALISPSKVIGSKKMLIL
jgi:hypothetical protein